MINKVKECLDKEYAGCVKMVECKKRNPKGLWWVDKQMCDNAIQRGLGVVQFAQSIGISYEQTESMYEKYRTELEDLKKEIKS